MKTTDLGLSGYGSHPAYLSALECVNDTTLPDVRVSHKSDRYLLLIGMQVGKLSQELDQGTFPEAVIWGGMESDSRVSGCEMLDITGLKMDRVTKVSDERGE